MAAILRSSVGKAARHAFSMEGTFSVRPLHAGRPTNCTPTVGMPHVKQFSNCAKVDPSLVKKKIEDVARRELMIESMERLAQEQKSETISSHPLGVALTCFLAISFAGSYLTGHWVGFCEATVEEYQASSRKQV